MRQRDSLTVAIVAVGLLLPTGLQATEPADQAAQQTQLDLGTAYERLHDWEKAEIQFVAAAKGPSEKARARAFEGIERARWSAAADSSSLKLGDFYATRHLWSEAEKQYLAAAQSGIAEVQRRGLQGLKCVRDRMPGRRVAEFDTLSGLIGRALAAIGGLVVIAISVIAVLGVRQIRRRIEVLPFVASSEASGAQIIYWLAYTQAMILSSDALPRPSGTTGPSSLLPYLQLPGLAETLPELGEIAGVKVPANELLQRLARPRVRVSGGWMVGASHGTAFAEFERRRGLLRYEPYATIKRDIPLRWQDQELELFAYHILIKAAETYVS